MFDKTAALKTKFDVNSILVMVAILLVPVSSILPLGPNVWYVQAVVLLFLLCLSIILQLFKFNIWLALLNLICLYSAFVTANQSLRALFYLFIFNIASLASFRISKFTKLQREACLRIIIVLFFIQSFWLVLQIFNLDPIFNQLSDASKDDTVGLSGSRNQLGLFYAISAPLVAHLNPFLLFFSLLGLWFSKTSAAFVATMISMAVYFNFISKHLLGRYLALLLAALVIFLIKFETISKEVYYERFDLWKNSINETMAGRAFMRLDIPDKNGKLKPALNIVTTNKWAGFGFGNFFKVSPYTQWQFMDDKENVKTNPEHRYEHMHNDYLEMFYETGIPGFIAVLGLVFSFFIDFYFAKKTKLVVVVFCCILAQLISALGIYTIYTGVSGVLLIVLYGLFKGEVEYGKDASLG